MEENDGLRKKVEELQQDLKSSRLACAAPWALDQLRLQPEFRAIVGQVAPYMIEYLCCAEEI